MYSGYIITWINCQNLSILAWSFNRENYFLGLDSEKAENTWLRRTRLLRSVATADTILARQTCINVNLTTLAKRSSPGICDSQFVHNCRFIKSQVGYKPSWETNFILYDTAVASVYVVEKGVAKYIIKFADGCRKTKRFWFCSFA